MNDDTDVLPRTPTETEHEDLTSAIAHAAPKRWWNRTTLVLAGLVLLVGGFLGGVQVHKQWGSASTTATASSGTPAGGGFPGGAGMPSGAAGPDQARPGSGTSGTVSKVDGGILYVQTAAGETVTVRTTDTTTVSKTTSATVAELVAGLKVTVQGVADSEGIISATAITAS
ncbi:hypothetical protein BJY16_003937 [Actinoplanes octamycinicus]|uniref:DUF5666 domain-containing protein n=1 Tax=Actinoplanes octamycinicus TaxID=135948 RepID=A0A7W7M836_9ACTN|nr:hypothetical protein [Actinoplanes octamycinicus]MBB4740478.1 hypothetical protein [Actinoplanes octamycinicus]GIE59738.1 hypothetical protein Aoc01nite_51400 [Actinoplanes octamycinicus]